MTNFVYHLLPQRFWDKIEFSETGCWIWVGAKSTNGYGRFFWEGKLHTVHRLSYELLIGPIPDGLTLDHLCRVRACANPDDLEPVTHKENCQRGKWATTTHCPKGHPYNEENTYRYPDGKRDCRACQRRRNKAYYYQEKLKKRSA